MEKAALIHVSIQRGSQLRATREPAPARERRARVWFHELERMRSALGVRAQTSHVEPRGWARAFDSGNLPGDALLKALALAD